MVGILRVSKTALMRCSSLWPSAQTAVTTPGNHDVRAAPSVDAWKRALTRAPAAGTGDDAVGSCARCGGLLAMGGFQSGGGGGGSSAEAAESSSRSARCVEIWLRHTGHSSLNWSAGCMQLRQKQ